MSVTRILLCLAVVLAACNRPPTQAEYDQTRGSRVDVFFNDPGTRPDNRWSPDAIPILVDLIDNTTDTLDFAAMDFNRQEVIDAVIRAYDRGVKVRFVGDAGYINAAGYVALDNRQIPMVVGNDPHIMHNKFFIMDGRFVWAETANVSDDDMTRNWNNFVFIDSPPRSRPSSSRCGRAGSAPPRTRWATARSSRSATPRSRCGLPPTRTRSVGSSSW